MLEVMVGLVQEGITMMVVSHEMGCAKRIANRIVFMDKGLIIDACTKDEFFGTQRSERTRDFLTKIIH